MITQAIEVIAKANPSYFYARVGFSERLSLTVVLTLSIILTQTQWKIKSNWASTLCLFSLLVLPNITLISPFLNLNLMD